MILVRHVIDTEHAAYGIFVSRQPRWFSHGSLVSRPSGPTARGLIKRNHQPLTTSSREAWQTYLLLPICILRFFANLVALNRFEHFQSFHWLSAANEETGYTFIRFFARFRKFLQNPYASMFEAQRSNTMHGLHGHGVAPRNSAVDKPVW